MTKRVAVVGAGYAGMAVSWHLLQRGAAVTLFDPNPLGSGASGVAAGLLHTFMGIDARLPWRGREGYEAAIHLLEIASKASIEPVFLRSGMLRVAKGERQCVSYRQRSQEHEDVTWLEPGEVVNIVPGIVVKPAILIHSAVAVNGFQYLHGLWNACEACGAQLERYSVDSLDALTEFDAIVVTAGALTPLIPQLKGLPIHKVKGQLLQLEWPVGYAPLPLPVNSNVYCVMDAGGQTCFVGATYERGNVDATPDLKQATAELMPKICELLPFLADAKVVGVRAGLRGSTPGHLPIAKQVSANVWVLAGFGSKGLLYHALLAEQIASECIN